MAITTYCKSKSAIFISDLHLNHHSEKLFLFQTFLDRIASQYQDLFILGDFFDIFLTEEEDALNSVVGEILRDFAKQHRVYFMRGNHDFAVTVDYCHKYSLNLLPDPCAIDIADKPVLLTHGDLLCTDDLVYMIFRRDREKLTKFCLNEPPKQQRQAFQQWIAENHSYYHSLGYTSTSLTYVFDTVQQNLTRWHCDDIIFGHVHKLEKIAWQNTTKAIQQMFVMADWSNDSFNFISLNQDKLDLVQGKWLMNGEFALETEPTQHRKSSS